MVKVKLTRADGSVLEVEGEVVEVIAILSSEKPASVVGIPMPGLIPWVPSLPLDGGASTISCACGPGARHGLPDPGVIDNT